MGEIAGLGVLLLAGRNVAGDRYEKSMAVDPALGDRQFQIEGRSLASLPHALMRFLPGSQSVPDGFGLFPVPGRRGCSVTEDQLFDGFADDVRGRIAEQPFGGRIERNDPALGIERYDGITRRGDDGLRHVDLRRCFVPRGFAHTACHKFPHSVLQNGRPTCRHPLGSSRAFTYQPACGRPKETTRPIPADGGHSPGRRAPPQKVPIGNPANALAFRVTFSNIQWNAPHRDR